MRDADNSQARGVVLQQKNDNEALEETHDTNAFLLFFRDYQRRE